MASPSNKTKYNCTLKPEMTKTFDFVSLSQKSCYHFYCLLCQKRCFAGSREWHMANKIRTRAAKEVSPIEHVLVIFIRHRERIISSALTAEDEIDMSLMQQNTLFNISDHLTSIMDSCFAGKTYSARRTKTACIINCIRDV